MNSARPLSRETPPEASLRAGDAPPQPQAVAMPAGAASVGADRSGDPPQFWAVWERYRGHLFRVCLRVMNGNRPDAEDALGQLMMKAREKLPAHVHDIADVGAWLTRFARNECIDIQRKRRTRLQLVERWCEEEEIERLSETPAADVPSRPDLMQNLREAVARLPPRLREPLALRFLDRMPYDGIATRLGIRVDCARKRVQQARSLLRTEIAAILASRENGRAEGGQAVARAAVATGRRRAAERLRPDPIPAGFRAVVTRVVEILRPDGGMARVPIFLEKRPVREKQKLATLHKYIRRHPGGWKFRFKLAELLYQTGAWDAAVPVYQEVLRQRPDLGPAALQLGNILYHTGRRGEAEAVFAQSLRWVRQPDDAHHLTGMIAWMRRDFAAAATALRAASEAAPASPAHWQALAGALLEAREWNQALQTLDEALARAPRDLVALTLGHQALVALQREDEALRRAQRVLEFAPDDPQALRRVAELTRTAV